MKTDKGTVDIKGKIDVSGGNATAVGEAGGGGGAAGTIYLRACDIYIRSAATLDATGGDAGDSTYDGGGGGGGIIVLTYICPDTMLKEPGSTIDKTEGWGWQLGGQGIYGEYAAPNIYLHDQLDPDEQDDPIDVGGEVKKPKVKFWFKVADPDAFDELSPEVEIVPAKKGKKFNGKNLFKGKPINWNGGDPITLEVIVENEELIIELKIKEEGGQGEEEGGGEETSQVLGITAEELFFGGEYKWRARVLDGMGIPSEWVEFANNGDATDFKVAPVPWCGNGAKEPGEQCDGSDFGGETCVTRGYSGGDLTCTDTCLIEEECWYCGNGVIEPGNGEQCDDGNLGGLDCTYFDSFTGGVLGCSDDCLYDTDNCEIGPYCGDGYVDPGEQCDGGVEETDCTTIDEFESGVIFCNDQCEIDTSNCYKPGPDPECGNGIIEPGEQCDGGVEEGRNEQ